MDFRYQFAAVKGPKGLVIQGRPFPDRTISTLGNGQEVVLTLEPRKEKRSNQQNRFMWGACYDQILHALLTDGGYRRDEWPQMKELLHEGLCAKYQGYVECPVTKQQVRKFRTSKATKAEFSAYIEWLAQYVAEEYGVAIALPGEAA